MLLASALPEARRNRLLNPASLRQVLAQAAARLPERSAFEQGAGRLDLLRSAQALADYTPRATAVPEGSTSRRAARQARARGHAPGGGGSGGYLWPYRSQPLYAGAVPLLINLTLLNGMSVAGNFSRLRAGCRAARPTARRCTLASSTGGGCGRGVARSASH